VVEREETDIPISELWIEGKLAVLPEVLNRGFFQVRLSRENLTIYAGQFVGLVPLNERIVINVQPKIPIPRLLRVLGRAETKIRSLATFPVGYRAATFRPLALLEPFASTLVAQLRRLQGMGFLKEYTPVSSDDGPLRGRILFDQSLRQFWSKGLQHRAAVSFYDLTANVPSNQVLKSAVDHLLRQFRYLPEKPKSVMHDLGDYQELFAALDITDIEDSKIRGAEWKRLPEPYREAAELATLIVQGRGVELPASGDVRLPSFLLDMAEVFESYVRNVIRTALSPTIQVLDGNKEGACSLYDEKPLPLATPDIVFKNAAGVSLVADVKYKDGPSREDINQIVTYAVRYKIKRVLLVCLSTAASGQLKRLGAISGIEVDCFDFSLSAANLDSEETELVNSIRNMILAPVS
jgi:5-methylcytosine-specific restriction enzyme subunit McrC